MLVLSRKSNEGLCLKIKNPDGTEREVNIKVIEIQGRRVRLGLEADDDVKIYRDELLTEKQPV